MATDEVVVAEAREAFFKAFHRGERYALWQEIRRRPAELLPFNAVAKALHLFSRFEAGIQQVPLDSIVGSVDRPSDFWRNFLPRQRYLFSRWCRVYAHTMQYGFSPVSLFKVSDIYFVNDGNHRISVLRAIHASSVEADVVEFPCRVRLGPDLRMEDIARKEAYAEFLEQTDLDRWNPQVEIELSHSSGYRTLEEHIAGHAYWLEYVQGHPVSVFRAASSWYDLVYRPTVDVIREMHLLRDFPGLREGDLYIRLTEFHRELVRELGTPVPFQTVVEMFRASSARPFWRRLWYRLRRRTPALHVAETGHPPAEPAPSRSAMQFPTRATSSDADVQGTGGEGETEVMASEERE